MTNSSLANPGSTVILLQLAGWLLAGALLGSIHFLTLRWNAHMLVEGRTLLPLGLQLLRFAVLVVALTIVARTFGALPLLAAALGIVVARTMVLRWETQP